MEKVEGEHTPFTRVLIIGQTKLVNNTNYAPPYSARGADYQERIKIEVVKTCRPSVYLDMFIE